MKRWLGGAVLCALTLGFSADAHAGGLPVSLLSQARLGPICFDQIDSNAAVDCWLSKHPTVANAMSYKEPGFSGSWSTWPSSARDLFHTYFNQMVLFYKLGMPPNFPQPLATPLTLNGPPVQTYAGSWLTPADGKTAYLLLVGNNIAAELTAAFPWSIATYSATDVARVVSMIDALGDLVEPPTVPNAGIYFVGSGHAVPATPAYTLSFFKTNHLLGSSALQTIARLFRWERTLVHYYLDAGVNVNDMFTLFWGSQAPPISASQLVDGTIYTGPTGPTPGRFTAGCHGTMDFMKVMLQAVNIPVRVWNTANHATPYFPTVGRALSHGDDPYDLTGYVSPFAGFSTPPPAMYLATKATVDNLCDPTWTDPTWCEHKIGIWPAVIGIFYGSDYLMTRHCEDLAAGTAHATSKVLTLLKWYWPELSSATLQQMLEAVGMWTTLDAKAAAGFCS
jgi:hypothetical protein